MKRTITYMTQEGFGAIKQEYQNLKKRRYDFVKKLTQAADMGDRSENAAYSNAKHKLRTTDSRLRFLKKVIDFAKISIPTQAEFVEIGSYVQVCFKGKEFVFHIVGLHEADPLKRKISYKSPVGNALMRKRVGDLVRINLDDREIEYKILRIFL